jgi:protein-S-isoprenylcysteine O-methyltransferase Ste14
VRLLAPAVFLLHLLAMHGLFWLDRVVGGVGIPWPWTLSGLAPLLLGLAGNLALAWSFTRVGTPVMPGAVPAVLVTGGPYRFSRNPMYLGQVVILLGAAILHGAWLAFVPVPVLMVVLDRVFIRAEERRLATAFGASYEAYRRRVRRWL